MITTPNIHLYFQLFSPQNLLKTSSKMSSTRSTQTFYIVASSTGRLIKMMNAKRRQFADGPFVKVHNEIICLNKGDGDKYVAANVLYIPDTITAKDITGSGHLAVKRVEVSSWSTDTTAKMTEFFFGASKITVHKGVLDIEAIVGRRNAGAVTAILFGKGGKNIRAICQGEAKAFTQRAVAPFRLHIHAYSVKNKLAVEIRLKKKIKSINNDLVEKALVRKFGGNDGESQSAPKKRSRASQNRFGGLDVEEQPEAVEDFPALHGTSPPVSPTVVAPQDTLAAKLEDASVRGEVFKEYTPEDVVRSEDMCGGTESDDSGYDDMPALTRGMTTDEFFAAAASSKVAEWS